MRSTKVLNTWNLKLRSRNGSSSGQAGQLRVGIWPIGTQRDAPVKGASHGKRVGMELVDGLGKIPDSKCVAMFVEHCSNIISKAHTSYTALVPLQPVCGIPCSNPTLCGTITARSEFLNTHHVQSLFTHINIIIHLQTQLLV